MTNYYAYIEPKDKDKEDLIRSISDNNPIKIQSNYLKTIHNNIIHLGKKHIGRIFLWDANYIIGPKEMLFPRYDPTMESIEKFLSQVSPKITIFDDGGINFSCEKFLKIAYSDRGFSTTEYYRQTSPNQEIDKSLLEDISKKIPEEIKKNFSIGNGEFINDGLHFSSQSDFK